jgi:hypothetical protein
MPESLGVVGVRLEAGLRKVAVPPSGLLWITAPAD